MFKKESMLQNYDSNRSMIIKINASGFAIEACMIQNDEKERSHSIMFHSREMTSAEINYKIYDQELLIIVDIRRT
jgi:hypothetical protein